MSEIDNVVAGEPIEADWGNDIRDRAVLRYIDEVARDASVLTPVAGDVAYLTAPGLLTIWNGSEWVVYAEATDLDAFFARLDGANQPFTGDVEVPNLVTPGLVTVGPSGSIRGPRQKWVSIGAQTTTIPDPGTAVELRSVTTTNPSTSKYVFRGDASFDVSGLPTGQVFTMRLYFRWGGASTAFDQWDVSIYEPPQDGAFFQVAAVALRDTIAAGQVVELIAQRQAGFGGTIRCRHSSLIVEEVETP